MDFNLKALGAETVMVDRRIVAQLAECIGVMVKPREIVLAEEVYYRVQELETAESIEKIVGSFSKSREFQEHPQLSEALKNRLEEKFKAAEKAGIRLDLRHKEEPEKKSQDLER